MMRKIQISVAVILAVTLLHAPLHAVELKSMRSPAPGTDASINVSLRLIGGRGSVLMPGHEISLTFQTDRDAYVVIYNIDSEGNVNLLYPQDGKLQRITGRKVYFLPEPGTGVYWEAGEKTGIEYMHALAVAERDMLDENELYFLSKNRQTTSERQFRVDMDPLLAFNMIDEELLVDADYDLLSTDYTYFYINRRVEYPRFLCSKCHSPEKLYDPYAMECPEVVIEKSTYDEDLGFPYPELYHVRHVEEDNEDFYSTHYADRFSNDWDDDLDDTNIYLTIRYNDYHHPYHSYWPYYGGFFVGFYDPFWWDDYWWGFGYGWYGPYSWWWHPYHYYWAYNWRCYDWWYCGNWYGNDYYRRGHIHTDRLLVKRNLDYTRTASRIKRERVLSKSLLAQKRTEIRDRSIDRSGLANRLSRGTSIDETRSRRTAQELRGRAVERRIVHGADRRFDAYERTRNQDRVRETRTPRTPNGSTDTRDRGTTRGVDRSTRKQDSETTRSIRDRSAGTRSSSKDRRSMTTRRSRSSVKSERGTQSQKSDGRSSSSGGSTVRSKERSGSSSSSSSRSSARSSSASSNSSTRPARSSGSSSTSRSSSGRQSSTNSGSAKKR